MAPAWFNRGMHEILSGGTALSTDTMDVLLLQTSYTFDALDNFVTDLTPGTNEATGGSYARLTLASKTVTEDDTNGRAYFDAADIVFSAVPAQVAQMDAVVVFRNVGPDNDATSPVLFYLDFTAITGNGSDITVAWSDTAGSEGIAELT